ncbi:transcriptional regulatory [Fusarium mexicanum]|uniref:Transcriptional regulatory n=1 Tax=Fusarium mexicanum TaxID=751941 RepID=A0A8H5N4I2_9HYPO|nr:transcriptional regulatory [Fusarium mexicanum]
MTLSAAADLYFQYCHNQPYSLFHEETFRHRLVAQTLPEYLCLALLATASRFSQSTRPLLLCADQAWELAIKRSTANIDSAESLMIAQTIHLLCVIDYSDGRCRAAWIKLGLAVRIAQCYRFNTEPDPRLRPEVQEEYRRTFWSIYLLDRLMSCGRERPTALQDKDCLLRLPSNEQAFRDCSENRGPVLEQLTGDAPVFTELPEHSHFSVIILMAATLIRVVNYVLRKDSRVHDDVPWSTTSQYSALESTVWRLELNYGLLDPLNAVWEQTLTSGGVVDPRAAGPLIYGPSTSRIGQQDTPRILKQSLASARSHATALTMLQETENLGCITVFCFRGYCAMVAGSIHLLFASDSNDEIREASVRRYEEYRGLLLKLCRYWESSRLMFMKLERLYEDRSQYRQFFDYTLVMGEKPKLAAFWDSIDNWVPSSQSPSPEHGPPEPVQPIHFPTSIYFFDLAPADPWGNGNSIFEMDFSNGNSFM